MRVVAGLTLVLVLTGCAYRDTGGRPIPSTVEPTPSASPTPAPEDCSRGGVAITEGARDAAMGLRYQSYVLTNCDDEPFSVQGRPALAMYDKDGDPLPVRYLTDVTEITASLGGDFAGPATRVTAAKGERLAFGIVWRNLTDSFDPTQLGDILAITPAPGQQPHRLSGQHIDLGNTGKLALSPWRKLPNPPPGPSPSVPAPTTPSPTPTVLL